MIMIIGLIMSAYTMVRLVQAIVEFRGRDDFAIERIPWIDLGRLIVIFVTSAVGLVTIAMLTAWMFAHATNNKFGL